MACFNPTLVRLRQYTTPVTTTSVISFNPTLVRLRPTRMLLMIL